MSDRRASSLKREEEENRHIKLTNTAIICVQPLATPGKTSQKVRRLRITSSASRKKKKIEEEAILASLFFDFSSNIYHPAFGFFLMYYIYTYLIAIFAYRLSDTPVLFRGRSITIKYQQKTTTLCASNFIYTCLQKEFQNSIFF